MTLLSAYTPGMPRGTALVVGAGIGGLAAGIALSRIGWDVRIFERAPQLRATGFALSIAPNAVQALDALGVGDAVRAIAWPVGEAELRDRFGERHDMSMSVRDFRRDGGAAVLVHDLTTLVPELEQFHV